MWRGVLLLPLLLLSETLATADHRSTVLDRSREHSRHVSNNEPKPQQAGSESTSRTSSPLSRWWTTVDNLFEGTSLAETGFFNDLRLTFGSNTPLYNINNRRRSLHPRDQQVLKTKCHVRPTIPSTPPTGNGDVPNYTPTDSDGRPLPTQSIGDGHGGGGSEIIAVTSMCGNIAPGATGEGFLSFILPPDLLIFQSLFFQWQQTRVQDQMANSHG